MSTAATTRPRPRPRRAIRSSSLLLRSAGGRTLSFLLFSLLLVRARGGDKGNVGPRPPFPASFLVVVPRRSSPTTTRRGRCGARSDGIVGDGPLFMARGGMHGKKTRMIQSQRKKKSKDPKAPGRKVVKTRRKNDKRDGDGLADRTKKKKKPAQDSVALPSGRSNAPPWKVASAKETREIVKSELERRRRVRAGEAGDGDDDDGDGPPALGSSASSSDGRSLLSESDRSLLSWKRFRPDSDASGVSLVGSYLGKRLPPSLGAPEVAFLGRSNVGKSSLLNKLIERCGGAGGGGGKEAAPSDRARVGKTPGATASVNLYALLGRRRSPSSPSKPILGLADLPGFGYAKLSKTVKESVEIAAERYLGDRKELSLVVLLVDARRTPSDDDRAVLAALYDMGVPIAVVATKIDKISGSDALEGRMEEVRDGLGLPEGQPLPVSSVDGRGTKELWRILLDAAEGRAEELREELLEVGGKEEEEEDNDADEDDEEEDLAYDQGYDWIHGIRSSSGVPYEDDYSADYFEEEVDGDEEEEGEGDSANRSRELMAENEARQASERDSFRLKSLRKAARAMERRGEV